MKTSVDIEFETSGSLDIASNALSLVKKKMKAYEVLFDTPPDVLVTGTFKDASGELIFCNNHLVIGVRTKSVSINIFDDNKYQDVVAFLIPDKKYRFTLTW